MVKSQRASAKNGKRASAGGLAKVGGRGNKMAVKTKPGRKAQTAAPVKVPAAENRSSAASDQTAGPGRRSARSASRRYGFSNAAQTKSQRRQELPVSTKGVAKKSGKNSEKRAASNGKASRLSASGIWQAIQSAPGSVSKMLGPAVSPISNFIGSASQAVSSTFLRMRTPANSGAVRGDSEGVLALQRKLEGKTPQHVVRTSV